MSNLTFLSIPNLILIIILMFTSQLNASISHWECKAIDDYLTSSSCIDESGNNLVINKPNELGANWTVNLVFPGGSIFEGRSKDGIIFGKRIDPNGEILEGPILGKHFHGKIKTLYPDGGIRESIFIEGEEQGNFVKVAEELPPYWRCLDINIAEALPRCINGFGEEITFSDDLSVLGLNWDLELTTTTGIKTNATSRNGQIYAISTSADGVTTKGPVEGLEITGKGVVILKSGAIYEGDLLNGERHGQGKIITNEEEYTEGEWLNDGIYKGKSVGKNDENVLVTYEGYFDPETGEENGQGKAIWPNGDIYKGNFVQGLFHGYGEYIWKNGNAYKGYWVEGLKHGFGIYKNVEPVDVGPYIYDEYIGEFQKDKFSGLGNVLLDGQIVYMGYFLDGYRSGYGVYSAAVTGAVKNDEKTIFRGQWNSSLDGNAIEEFSDGSSYVGLSKDGTRHGMGKLNFPGIKKSQTGYFINGVMEGPGTEISDGIRIDVNFINGSKEGEAKITWEDGLQSIAMFKNDQYITDSLESDEALAFASNRLALVIGNDNYQASPLENAVSDSIGIKNALEEVGFQVIHSPNLDQENFLQAIWAFKRKLKSMGPSTTALFYYSGHALEVDGTNYLNPIDAVISSKFDLETQSINVARIFSALEAASSGVKIMILDACRNNPFTSFTRSSSQGLAQMSAPTGTIISYSTAPGKLALDGMIDGYSIYTGSLIQSIGIPGLTIEEAFKRTRQSVVRLSKSEQIPWESSSLLGDFYFSKE